MFKSVKLDVLTNSIKDDKILYDPLFIYDGHDPLDGSPFGFR